MVKTVPSMLKNRIAIDSGANEKALVQEANAEIPLPAAKMAPGLSGRDKTLNAKDSAHGPMACGSVFFGRARGTQASCEGKPNGSLVCLSSCDAWCAPCGEEQGSGILPGGIPQDALTIMQADDQDL